MPGGVSIMEIYLVCVDHDGNLHSVDEAEIAFRTRDQAEAHIRELKAKRSGYSHSIRCIELLGEDPLRKLGL